MSSIGVTEPGIEIMATKGDFHMILVKDLAARAANILKQEMLAAGGEAAVSLNVTMFKDDPTDVLIMATRSQLDRIIPKLRIQPYRLGDLADALNDLLAMDEVTGLGARDRGLDLGRTAIMGVLNVTPDSFSDGGRYLDRDSAFAWVQRMIEEGAAIVDIGGESSRPGAEPVSVEEELRRVIPVIEAAAELDITISVDTCKSEVARTAIEAGAHMVNDITAMGDPRMADVVAETGAAIVLMHMQGTPGTMQDRPEYSDLIPDIYGFLQERRDLALEAGIERDRIIVDPGIGFGKTLEHNLEILRELASFKGMHQPLLIGTSSKSFIGKVLDLPVEKRLEGTLASNVAAIMKGADIIRVHDVRAAARAVRLTDAILEKYLI